MICSYNDFSGDGIHCPFCGARFCYQEEACCSHLAYVVGESVVLWASSQIDAVIPGVYDLKSDAWSEGNQGALSTVRSLMKKAQNYIEFNITGANDVSYVAFVGDWDFAPFR